MTLCKFRPKVITDRSQTLGPNNFSRINILGIHVHDNLVTNVTTYIRYTEDVFFH